MTDRSRSSRLARASRVRLRPRLEALEPRLALATAAGLGRHAVEPMTVTMPSAANGMIGSVATRPTMTITGRAMPRALVKIEAGDLVRRTVADARGHYRFRMAMPPGTYQFELQARDKAGDIASTTMTATRGDAVIAWVDVMAQVLKSDTTNVGLVSRSQAMVSGAVYDAVNDIERTGSVYHVDVRTPAGSSPSAAASAAAYTVLSALDPSMAPLLQARMKQSLAALPAGSARSAGVGVGQEVARGILAWRADDGSAASVPYVAGSAPGQWRPTYPTYQDAWGPEWGQVEPFVLANPGSHVPPPPPALDSPEYAAALNQVESLGAADSTTRTADQTQAGLFWSYDYPASGTPPVFYDRIAAQIALQEHNSLAANARMFGLVNLAMGDAGIVAWDTKYTDDLWRPITAIRLADTDGNPATTADPSWTPLGSPGGPGQPSYTPPFPSYISGHATFGATMFDVLSRFYGTDDVDFAIGSDMVPGASRSFTSFSAAASENAWSRVYLGVHFSFDATEGLATGRAIGDAVFNQALVPLKHRPG